MSESKEIWFPFYIFPVRIRPVPVCPICSGGLGLRLPKEPDSPDAEPAAWVCSKEGCGGELGIGEDGLPMGGSDE